MHGDSASAPLAITSPAGLTITRISLAAFRNYVDIRADFDGRPVVLTGANGSGKTNFLEAISLLVPGRGLRRAALSDMQNIHESTPWAVAVDMQTPQGALKIGTGCASSTMSAESKDRRVIHIDGNPVRNQHALAEHVVMAWITPDMDRILSEGAGARRKLLDRLVFSFDPAHSSRVNHYEKALRERSRLLREGRADRAWLDALEHSMAQTGVAIAAARREMLTQLCRAIDETEGVFPRADLALQGVAEQALDEMPALAVEDRLRKLYEQTRAEDAVSGMCGVGPHRSDLQVAHRAKQCPAALCSTGEQKALLIAIMLAHVRTLTRHRNVVPLFLLDDIAAHLDEARRKALFEEILNLKSQAWLTGTDADAFFTLLPHAQHIRTSCATNNRLAG